MEGGGKQKDHSDKNWDLQVGSGLYWLEFLCNCTNF